MRNRVCIIGAGLSGAVVAHTLRNMGYDVTILEKDNRFGGKCNTISINGEPFELGGCAIGPSYGTILRLGRITKQPLLKMKSFYSLRNGQNPRKLNSDDEKKIFRATLETIRYALIAYAFKKNTKNDFSKIPPEFQESFSKWCDNNNFLTIKKWFELVVVSFGYGSLEKINTWYVLNYIDHKNIIGMWLMEIIGIKSAMRRFRKGFQNLVFELTRGTNIILNTKIHSIIRSKNRITVETQFGKESFDKLVITCPIDQIIKVLYGTEKEKHLAKEIKYYPYRTIACEIPKFPKGVMLIKDNLKEGRFGHVSLIGNSSDQNQICVCYIPETIFNRNWIDSENNIRADIQSLGWNITKIYEKRAWKYFPHVKNLGFYKILQSIQGKNNTYYAGGMCSFELTESIAYYSEKLILDHFPGRIKTESFSFLRNLFYWFSGVR